MEDDALKAIRLKSDPDVTIYFGTTGSAEPVEPLSPRQTAANLERFLAFWRERGVTVAFSGLHNGRANIRLGDAFTELEATPAPRGHDGE